MQLSFIFFLTLLLQGISVHLTYTLLYGFCTLRPALGTPMAWHYSWYLALSILRSTLCVGSGSWRPLRGPRAHRISSNIRIIAATPEIFAVVRSMFEIFKHFCLAEGLLFGQAALVFSEFIFNRMRPKKKMFTNDHQ